MWTQSICLYIYRSINIISDNGSSPIHYQSIPYSKADLLSGPIVANITETGFKIYRFLSSNVSIQMPRMYRFANNYFETTDDKHVFSILLVYIHICFMESYS